MASEIEKRGAAIRPPNRFESQWYEKDLAMLAEEEAEQEINKKVRTEFIFDDAKSILSKNDSPDIGFTYSVNIYRGCEHGCSYCYARPTHEALGFDAGLAFESRIVVKRNAAELLEKALSKKSWKKETVVFSGVTDCYQPAERRFKIMRQCLEVMLRHKNPLGIVTKNILILRDLDLLRELANLGLVKVYISVTTLDEELATAMEPRTAKPQARLRAISELRDAGVKVGTLVAPIIPGLNDSEIPKILEAVSLAGATSAHYTLLRLPLAVKPIFLDWLERHFPQRADHVKSLLSDCRDGELYQNDFGLRMRGSGVYAEHIAQTFRIFAKRYGL